MSDHIGTDDRPRDALSAAHNEALAALLSVVSEIQREHRSCLSVDGCPWPVVTSFDVATLHDRLIAAGYQVVPI